MGKQKEQRTEQARGDREAFSIRLLKAMIAAGVNGPELARRLKRNPRTVSGWMRGDHLPDVGSMAEIGKALNCDAVWLLLGDRAADVA